MRVIYTPEDPADGDPHDWEFNPKRVRSSEVARVEDLYGKTWPVFTRDVQVQSAAALRVLLWHLMRRDHPNLNLKLADVPDFYMGEIVLQPSSQEIREQIDAIANSAGQLSDEEKRTALAAGEAEYAAAVEREQAEGVESPPLPDQLTPSEAATG